MVPGIDLKTSIEAIKLCAIYPGFYASCGIHPSSKLTNLNSEISRISSLIGHENVRAIGEIGLDFYRNVESRKAQINIFKQQLEMAALFEKPVIIHNREADDELWTILESWYANLSKNSSLFLNPGVLHAFSGSLELAKKAIQNNFLIGVAGPITFKNAQKLRNVISQIPLESLIIETDAPYLAPHPHRGKRNEPSFLHLIAEKVGAIHGVGIKSVAKITTINAKRLFKI